MATPKPHYGSWPGQSNRARNAERWWRPRETGPGSTAASAVHHPRRQRARAGTPERPPTRGPSVPDASQPRPSQSTLACALPPRRSATRNPMTGEGRVWPPAVAPREQITVATPDCQLASTLSKGRSPCGRPATRPRPRRRTAARLKGSLVSSAAEALPCTDTCSHAGAVGRLPPPARRQGSQNESQGTPYSPPAGLVPSSPWSSSRRPTREQRVFMNAGLALPRPAKFKSTSRPPAPLRPATRGKRN